VSESKAPRRPGGRRPIPPLIFLVVLAILAVAVWWQVIRKDEDQSAQQSAPCTLTASEQQIADLNNMANIQIHVLNGTDQAGLAASIQAELTGRGFTVLDIGNASGAGIPEAGTIRYGSGNQFQASVVAAHFPDFLVDRSNDITDGSIQLTAGQAYAGPADANAAAQTVQGLIADQAKIVAGCPSPED
jgi:hypothetical protein